MRMRAMPFRQGYEGVYDHATLALLQDIFEYVWLAVADSLSSKEVTRDYIAHRIIAAHEAGLSPEAIKNRVILELTQKNLSDAQVPRGNRDSESEDVS
jgi:hypothetical protein